MKYIWVFTGVGNSSFPSGVFSEKSIAEKWIFENRLEGTLTKYPIDVPLYDWSVANGYFTPKNEFQKNSKAIANFSSAYLEHYHYKKEEE